jgi:hypothetical protein
MVKEMTYGNVESYVKIMILSSEVMSLFWLKKIYSIYNSLWIRYSETPV